MKPTAVLFDIGGTLLQEDSYDLRKGVAALFREPIFRQAHSANTEEALTDELSRQIDEAQKNGSDEFTLLSWLRASIPSGHEIDLQNLEMDFWYATAVLSPMPQVEEALQVIRDARIPMGAVSNAIFSSKTLISELSRHGLAWALDFVISSADLTKRKPDPRIFKQALTNLKTTASSVWFVGDSWESDILGSTQVGMSAIWLSRLDAPDPHVQHTRVGHWQEFAQLFQSVL